MRTILELQDWLDANIEDGAHISLDQCEPSKAHYNIGKPLIRLEFNINGCDHIIECALNTKKLKKSFDKVKTMTLESIKRNR